MMHSYNIVMLHQSATARIHTNEMDSISLNIPDILYGKTDRKLLTCGRERAIPFGVQNMYTIITRGTGIRLQCYGEAKTRGNQDQPRLVQGLLDLCKALPQAGSRTG